MNVLSYMANLKAVGANQQEPVGTGPLKTTNLGVRSSNLFGRAITSMFSERILASINLPCRMKKSAWYLHGCARTRYNSLTPLVLPERRAALLARKIRFPYQSIHE